MEKYELLKKYFGYDAFRHPQDQIIDAVQKGKDVIAILPTGFGKSILFQISALLLHGVTIVVSPLIALMDDQVSNLRKKGISATVIHSGLTILEQNEIYNKINLGKIKIIYLSPERLENKKFLNSIQQLKICLFVVDEAHTLLWGETFRVSFLNVKDFIIHLSPRPIILAVTATATALTISKIVSYLHMENPKQFIAPIDRRNLCYSVIQTKNKLLEIEYLLEKYSKAKGIIYCLTRREVEHLWNTLELKGYSVTYYHGGMDAQLKHRNQKLFSNNNKNIMVCTNAFGMGIDLPAIRFILQYNLPQSVEDLVQQMGRASRDGARGEGILLFSFSDLQQGEYFINQIEDRSLRKQQQKKLDAVVDYALTKKCRHQWISKYFEQQINRCQCMCDNCKRSR